MVHVNLISSYDSLTLSVEDHAPSHHLPLFRITDFHLGTCRLCGSLAAYNRNDHANALIEWRPLAEQGDARAQYHVGWVHERGEGVKGDYAQAVARYRKVAEQGYAPAQFNIASICRRAAEQCHAGAQYNLGIMYARGRGTLSMLSR